MIIIVIVIAMVFTGSPLYPLAVGGVMFAIIQTTRLPMPRLSLFLLSLRNVAVRHT